MAISFLDVTPDLLVELCKGLVDGNPKEFVVEKNAIPKDAKVVGVELIPGQDVIRIALESSEFMDEQSIPCPQLKAVFAQTY